MAEFDLLHKIAPFLDRHLVFPLVEYLSSLKIYDETDLLRGKLELLKSTNMVDFEIDTYQKLHGTTDIPPDLVSKREAVLNRLHDLQEKISSFLTFIEDEETMETLSRIREMQTLHDKLQTYGFSQDDLECLHEYGKFQFDCGRYEPAKHVLRVYTMFLPRSQEKANGAVWGQLASSILNQNFEDGMEELQRVKQIVDHQAATNQTTPLKSLQQRAWWIHWGLFIFFNHPSGLDAMIETCLNDGAYMNAIQAMCPHVLRFSAKRLSRLGSPLDEDQGNSLKCTAPTRRRYLTAAVISTKRRKGIHMRDLVKVIQQEAYNYSDPLTEFLLCLQINFDFEAAQQKLRDCQVILNNDLFLISIRETFVDQARWLIFETFCRIHRTVSIDMLANKLDMSQEAAEQWIVELIRNARIEAKIDSQLGQVVMNNPAISPYQQVIDKTKNLAFRSQTLSIAIEKRVKSELALSPGGFIY